MSEGGPLTLHPEQREALIAALSVPRFATAMNRSPMLKAIVKGGFAGLHKLADVDLLACHIEAFKREFPYEDIKVSSAEVSAEAPERLLTDEQRRVVIEALVDDTVAFIRKDVEYLQNLLREGRGGYQDMTDEALLIEHEDMIGRYEHDPRPETPKP